MDDTLSETISGSLDTYRTALFELLRQPSVSTTGEGMDEAPEAVAAFVERFGFGDTRLIETGRHPLVYAERLSDPDAPTVLFYGHYDVQPPGDESEWESPAFEPTVRDERIYARGAGDNKGQFAAHVFALHALLAADAAPDANVKLLVEGGEESGSRGLFEYLDAGAPDVTDADVLYIADGPMHATSDGDGGRRSVPTVTYGNRGVLSFQLDLRTANTDLHSGNFGGPVPNAATELVAVLDSFVDGEDIAVDGFHDGVAITDADRDLVDAIPADEEALEAQLGLDRLATERGFYRKLFLEPSLTINGLQSGYQGDGMKTVLPCRATAKLDCRLVPDQDPDAVFETVRAHVEARNPSVEVTKHSSFAPMKTPVDHPVADDVVGALRAVWDEEPAQFPVLGGSLPAAYFRTVPELREIPAFVVPYANHDQGNHAPNEHLDLDCFEKGIRTSAAFLRRVGADQ
ncbi:M20/M25/M40 family metallo-hydrolase [Haloferacaceae archaeon DSL9]